MFVSFDKLDHCLVENLLNVFNIGQDPQVLYYNFIEIDSELLPSSVLFCSMERLQVLLTLLAPGKRIGINVLQTLAAKNKTELVFLTRKITVKIVIYQQIETFFFQMKESRKRTFQEAPATGSKRHIPPFNVVSFIQLLGIWTLMCLDYTTFRHLDFYAPGFPEA